MNAICVKQPNLPKKHQTRPSVESATRSEVARKKWHLYSAGSEGVPSHCRQQSFGAIFTEERDCMKPSPLKKHQNLRERRISNSLQVSWRQQHLYSAGSDDVPSHRRQQSFGAVFTKDYDLCEAAEPTKRTSNPARAWNHQLVRGENSISTLQAARAFRATAASRAPAATAASPAWACPTSQTCWCKPRWGARTRAGGRPSTTRSARRRPGGLQSWGGAVRRLCMGAHPSLRNR
jgi:hypothetical protein